MPGTQNRNRRAGLRPRPRAPPPSRAGRPFAQPSKAPGGIFLNAREAARQEAEKKAKEDEAKREEAAKAEADKRAAWAHIEEANRKAKEDADAKEAEEAVAIAAAADAAEAAATAEAKAKEREAAATAAAAAASTQEIRGNQPSGINPVGRRREHEVFT